MTFAAEILDEKFIHFFPCGFPRIPAEAQVLQTHFLLPRKIAAPSSASHLEHKPPQLFVRPRPCGNAGMTELTLENLELCKEPFEMNFRIFVNRPNEAEPLETPSPV